MIYHFVVGEAAGEPLLEAVRSEGSMRGEVIMLKDKLHLGPLQKQEGQSFSELRSEFWNTANLHERSPVVLNDMERLLEISAVMFKDERVQAWLWMAPAPEDVSAYYWLLPYLSKHKGRFFILNISGLPFLDSEGKLFFPKNIAQIPAKELIKARKLARPVTLSEIEMDTDEWKKLVMENAALRIHEGGKKLVSRAVDFYDAQLLDLCNDKFQKASKIIRLALQKNELPAGDLWLGRRLRQMVETGMLMAQGDLKKNFSEWELKLPGTLSQEKGNQPGAG